MAVIFLAYQTRLDREVALKRLELHGRGPDLADRFLREAKLAGSFEHPNIVTVHDTFEHDGRPYIAMEYLRRGSLRSFMERGLTEAQVFGVLEGILEGLGHAASRGVVHRDIKPENILVTDRGRVKIADFGIAKAYTQVTSAARLTETGMALGTPLYMSPEQALARPVGPYTDLYAVGAMAYEMVSGTTPFDAPGAPMAILLRHINEPPPPLPAKVEPRLAEWIMWLLAKEPAARPDGPEEAWEHLEEIAVSEIGPYWRREAALLDAGEVGPLRRTPTPIPSERLQDGVPTLAEPEPEPEPDPVVPATNGAAGYETVNPLAAAANAPTAESEPVVAPVAEPVVTAVTPEPVVAPVAEPEPEPVEPSGYATIDPLAAPVNAPEPEPEPVAVVPVVEPEPELEPEPVAVVPVVEPEPEPEPEPVAVVPVEPAGYKTVDPVVVPVTPLEPDEPAHETSNGAAAVEPDDRTLTPSRRPTVPLDADPGVTAVPTRPLTPPPVKPAKKRPVGVFIAAGAAVVAIAGAAVAYAAAPEQVTRGPVPLTSSVRATDADVKVPAGWTAAKADSAEALPGLALASATTLRPPAAPAGDAVVIGSTDGTEASLVPAAARKALGKPTRVKLGQTAAFQYGPTTVDGTKYTVYAVPTAKGATTLVCRAQDEGDVTRSCDGIARSLHLQNDPYALAPRKQFATDVDAVSKQLASDEQSAARQLAKADRYNEQAAALKQLAKAYGTAGTALDKVPAAPFEEPTKQTVVKYLGQLEGATSSLATAAAKKQSKLYADRRDRYKQLRADLQTEIAALPAIGHEEENA